MGLGLALGLGALGAGIFGSVMNRNSVRDSNAANERLSWQQWHATNAYNHPKRQMERFREAGLNPNLIYGQMSNVPPPAAVRSIPVPGIDVGFDKLADYMQNREAFELNKANTEHQMLMSEAGLELQKQRLNSDLDIKNRELSLQEQLLPYKIDQIRTDNAMARMTMENMVNSPLDNSSSGIAKRIVEHKNFGDLPWYYRYPVRAYDAASEWFSKFNPFTAKSSSSSNSYKKWKWK